MFDISLIASKGGPIVLLLALCSLIVGAITIERIFFWISEKKRINKGHLTKCLKLVASGELNKASSFCNQSKNPLLSRLSKIVQLSDAKLISDAVCVELNSAQRRCSEFMSGLTTVAAVSPLLGILGTVFGIIKSFGILEKAILTDPSLVGAGLAEALLTTAIGLTIACICIIISSFFNSLTERHLRMIESFGEELEIQESLNERKKNQINLKARSENPDNLVRASEKAA